MCGVTAKAGVSPSTRHFPCKAVTPQGLWRSFRTVTPPGAESADRDTSHGRQDTACMGEKQARLPDRSTAMETTVLSGSALFCLIRIVGYHEFHNHFIKDCACPLEWLKRLF